MIKLVCLQITSYRRGVEGSTCWKISPLLPAPSYRLLARGGERGEYCARIMEGVGVDHRTGKEKGKCLKQGYRVLIGKWTNTGCKHIISFVPAVANSGGLIPPSGCFILYAK